MTDEDQGKREQQYEANAVFLRLRQLHENPISGSFDAEHLKSIHAHLFQDLPHHQPGVIRERTERAWIKNRVLEGHSRAYAVHYANDEIEEKLQKAFDDFGGVDAFKKLSLDAAASSLTKLYGDLDHAHGFFEGNSRTLREFTREFASEAGYALAWGSTNTGTKERNQLYLARDLAVMERAFPDLTPERAMNTNDRAEYEASFVIDYLRQAVGSRTLSSIIRDDLSLEVQREPSLSRLAPTRDEKQTESSFERDKAAAKARLAGFVDRTAPLSEQDLEKRQQLDRERQARETGRW